MSYSWVTPQQDLQITTICHMMQMAAGLGQHDTVDYLIHTRGSYDYFLLLLVKSSIWFTKKQFFKIILYFFNTLKCAANYVT